MGSGYCELHHNVDIFFLFLLLLVHVDKAGIVFCFCFEGHEGYGTVAIWDSGLQGNLGVWSWDCRI